MLNAEMNSQLTHRKRNSSPVLIYKLIHLGKQADTFCYTEKFAGITKLLNVFHEELIARLQSQKVILYQYKTKSKFRLERFNFFLSGISTN